MKRKKIHSIKKPELVCPAGDWASLLTAVENGADSVYFGVKGINMRNFATNFDVAELSKIMKYLHAHNTRGYLTLNVIVMNHELNKVLKILKKAKSAGVDAVILWDMAVFSMARELGLRVHISTQASISNFKALKYYAKLGAKRVVLARECKLADIKDIVKGIEKEKINCEVESFIHGAMCISISGRCFLSSYSSGKSANRGECQQYCRREFSIIDDSKEGKYILGQDYVLSAKDLCSIDFIDKLIKAGIHSFKIEGRMRSPEYVKVATSVYRCAIDTFSQGKLTLALKRNLKQELGNVFTRGFSSGFYYGIPQDALSRRNEHKYEKVFLGEVTKFYKKINVVEILVRNKGLRQGAELLFMGNKTPACFAKAEEIQQKHKFVKTVKQGEYVGIKVPFLLKRNDKVFLWQKRKSD
ncbi:MAG: U32 family peptidase [PVC group bacterium]|nr:U32 family peptidase [PVC group bacterium]